MYLYSSLDITLITNNKLKKPFIRSPPNTDRYNSFTIISKYLLQTETESTANFSVLISKYQAAFSKIYESKS